MAAGCYEGEGAAATEGRDAHLEGWHNPRRESALTLSDPFGPGRAAKIGL